MSFEKKIFLVTVKYGVYVTRQQGLQRNMVRPFSKAHGSYIKKKKENLSLP